MRVIRIISCIFVLTFSFPGFCQSFGAGLYNSPKGFGLSFAADGQNGTIHKGKVFADLYGVIDGRFSQPGIKVEYSYGLVFKEGDKEHWRYRLYAGPGISSGYLRDNPENGAMGVLVALNGSVGSRFIFDKGIALDFGFTADLGFLLTDNGGETRLTMYRNGISRAFFPYLSIEFLF